MCSSDLASDLDWEEATSFGAVSATTRHPYSPQASFDGGTLDCGSGLLLLIRQHIDPLRDGELLEIRSSEGSVCEDLPAWCRMTGNELVSEAHAVGAYSFLVAKGRFVPPPATAPAAAPRSPDRKSTRLNSSHSLTSRMPSSA